MTFKTPYKTRSWKNDNFSEVKISLLCENNSSKEIQIILPKDKTMSEHSAPNDIVVQVLSGEIDFCIQNEVFNLKALDSIEVLANIKHSLYAKENSIIRLSLGKNDDITRVKNVEID